jgi:hypothetical protein
MIGKVIDIIEDEDTSRVVIEIPTDKADQLWPMVGKEVVIAWVK